MTIFGLPFPVCHYEFSVLLDICNWLPSDPINVDFASVEPLSLQTILYRQLLISVVQIDNW